MNKVTIKDVAREAGVSISTVSNALNGVDVLNPKTKEKILEVVKRLNYIPNLNGRNLKATQTKAIGLFISSIKGSFYGVLADSMYWECQKHGYELYIYITNKNTTILNSILGRRVDAAAILYEGVTEETVERLRDSEIPVVFLDREVKGKCMSSITFDSFYEGEQAGKYLLSLGNKSFGHIYGVPGNYDSRQRYDGFVKALGEQEISLEEENIISGMFEKDAAYQEMKKFLEEGRKLPDAFFASNDLSALGGIEALREKGIRVPEDVNVIGCDDIETCELVSPKLTTIRTSFEKMGIIVANHLMEMLAGEKEGKIEKITGKIIERETCRAK